MLELRATVLRLSPTQAEAAHGFQIQFAAPAPPIGAPLVLSIIRTTYKLQLQRSRAPSIHPSIQEEVASKQVRAHLVDGMITSSCCLSVSSSAASSVPSIHLVTH